MSKFSSKEHLGETYGLVVALAFPVIYGLYDFITQKKFNFFSVLGFVSVLLTGGIGLLKLDRGWITAKETAIPLIMGLVILASQYTKKPLVRSFFGQIFDIDKINAAFKDKGLDGEFEKKIYTCGFYLSGTFFLSAVLNYFLAVAVLKGDTGTVEFNESLGKMMALSFPVITLPMMITGMLIMYFLFRSITKTADLDIESVIKTM